MNEYFVGIINESEMTPEFWVGDDDEVGFIVGGGEVDHVPETDLVIVLNMF
jgi:hypothetical protein